ncbi:hypothetical protein CDL15_Pgr003064 [Punica granatum]|uniref:HIRAN domain-containing protein n=1 Tax=Punica granatum TaxID=22663 RepID=A0A218X1R9_PUNGR|nr:hypothetical protein CDL15_Pgr003064 [Punica granatum]
MRSIGAELLPDVAGCRLMLPIISSLCNAEEEFSYVGEKFAGISGFVVSSAPLLTLYFAWGWGDYGECSQLSQYFKVEGCLFAHIVSLYPGTVNGSKLVVLVREPGNIQESNAIKLLNARNVQVGHIECSVAAVLAPLMDSGMIVAKGLVPKPRDSGNRDKIVCQVFILAREQAAEVVKDTILQGGSELMPVMDIFNGGRRSGNEIFNLVAKKANEKAKMEALAMEPPKEVIKSASEGGSPVAGSQRNCLRFGRRKTGNTCVLTHFETQERLDPLRGGIFVGDMGMGKTLILLSLIALEKFGGPTVCLNDKKSGEEGETSEVVPPVLGSRKRREST